MARRPLDESINGSKPVASAKTKKAESTSRKRWLEGLNVLLRQAQSRFGDVGWSTDEQGTEDVVWAHKALLYARSSAGVLQRYLAGYKSSLPDPPSSNSSFTNLTAAWGGSPHGASLRSVSPEPSLMSTQTIRKPAMLKLSDWAMLEPLLAYIYLGQADRISEFQFLFEEAHLEHALLQDPLQRLSQDLLFMWRSKLYADVLIKLVPADLDGTADQTTEPDGEVFASHRAILATVPYFESILLGSYSDQDHRILTLPSPPFTPAALHFTLGYLYCGTLDFSQRTFDLSTAFSVWLSAVYLSIDALKTEIEARMEDMCFGPRPDPLRCARLYQWTLLPDVCCPILQQRAKGIVLDRFGEAWRIEIGSASQETQQLLVTEKCLSLTTDNVIDALKGVMMIRSKLDTISQAWAGHVLAMLQPVEARIAKMLSNDTTAVVTSSAFIDLIEGRGFSADVLERALHLLSTGLEERSAALAYQAVVGHVLLREDGIQVDARVKVEDCRQDIIKYLKARWVGTKATAGFNDLDSWALKEIADELEMKAQDLIAVDEPPPLPATKTGLRPIRKSAASGDSDPSLRTSILNRNAASTMIRTQGRIAPKGPSARTPIATKRPLRPSTTPASQLQTPVNSKPVKPPVSSGSQTTLTSAASSRKPRSSTSSEASATTAETSAEDLSPGLSKGKTPPQKPKSSHLDSVPSGRKSAEPGTTSTQRAGMRKPSQPSFSRRVRTVSQDGASTRSSVRSTAASLARERATAAAASKPPRSPSAASVRTALSNRAPSVRALSIKSSNASKSDSATPVPSPKAPSRPPSSRSIASTAKSASSMRSKTAVEPSAKVEKPASTKGSVVSKRSVTPTRDRTTSTKSVASSVRSSLSVHHGKVARKPPFGTSLHVGIRCVVSFTNGQKSTGSVLYLGPVPELGQGNYVGVEVDEPEDVTAQVQWSDGVIDGVKYFSQSRKRRNMQAGVFVRPPQVMYLF